MAAPSGTANRVAPRPARPIVLVVDDIPANRELLLAALGDLGYDVRQAGDGIEALEQFALVEPDLVLLDIEMPRMDGLTLCRKLKDDPRHRLVPVVLITAFDDRATKLRGIAAGADDFLTKPFDRHELLLRTKVLLRDRDMNKRLDGSEAVILALARVIEARDLYTVQHAERVGVYARALGEALVLGPDDLEALYYGGVLHDVGKSVIPSEILLKPGYFTAEERALMERHAIEGERICAPLRSTAGCLPIIRHHHERVDGTGYPDRLVGEEVPLGARIVAIVDAWDAMTSDRVYRKKLAREEALSRLRAGAGTQWDAAMVSLFLELLAAGTIDRLPHLALVDQQAVPFQT